MSAEAKAREALRVARGKDQFIHSIGGHPLERPLPAPIGADCPDHPSYPLVIKAGEAWCRRGQHFGGVEPVDQARAGV